MSTFALVHAAWHGEWCWERLIPHVESSGHTVVALDPPCDDPTVTTSDYARPVDSRLHGTDDDVILVGAAKEIVKVGPSTGAAAAQSRFDDMPRPGENWVSDIESAAAASDEKE